jgi:hypothetical protein
MAILTLTTKSALDPARMTSFAPFSSILVVAMIATGIYTYEKLQQLIPGKHVRAGVIVIAFLGAAFVVIKGLSDL